MNQKQIVEKITHLNQQLLNVHSLQLNFRNSAIIADFYRGKIAHYTGKIPIQNLDFSQPLSIAS